MFNPEKKILIVFGTRPEAIKMAPLVKEFQKYPERYNLKVCVTAQHREMLDQVLSFFDIVPDYDLNLMRPGQNLSQLTADILLGMKGILEDFCPDFVFVHGDTTTSMATALAAFYNQTKVCHVEAGLRTFNKHSPFPEEINRQITGRITDLHFAPTSKSSENLLKEGTNAENIVITGNTVIDALFLAQDKLKNYEDDEIKYLKSLELTQNKVILVTGHRRENFGEGFINICNALKIIAEDKDVLIIYPVHLNPNVQKPVKEILDGIDNILLIDPLGYPAFSWLMGKSYFIITDSGGVQEEAPSLGIPVLVMRDNTERPEAVDAGTVKLVGTNTETIVREAKSLLTDKEVYDAMSLAHNPYGDGLSASRIVKAINNVGE
ncbi:UDP-N-acetylglucosamine 2-epimerase (non-hydrolyzing) [Pedobacter sp. MC2016-15]|uniref:non-hydrolyzing UDP-N-acetylglucosamine 2-epimerase n=1 Tax=Pedobacter sp. MC2016-15 TaxID=2994473 RepID=UPI002245DC2B|nr:UDP-N-acetylglucosamine 2-epimerase (non-hydrolyzing) [Pedobacter sp. MC2016-15]MCX2481803.1 UDP-N-acetylglucosamine 2-epimerase (non-hydrolyzing) [Pedobacter sp. MC2016-15]